MFTADMSDEGNQQKRYQKEQVQSAIDSAPLAAETSKTAG